MTQRECVQLDHVLQMYRLGYHRGHRLSSVREPPVESATSFIVQHSSLLVARRILMSAKPHGLDMLVVLGLSELPRHRARHHVVRCTMLQCHLVRRDGLAHKVVANVDVLSALVLDGVLREANAPAVVDLDVDRPARDPRPQPLRCHALHDLVEYCIQQGLGPVLKNLPGLARVSPYFGLRPMGRLPLPQ